VSSRAQSRDLAVRRLPRHSPGAPGRRRVAFHSAFRPSTLLRAARAWSRGRVPKPARRSPQGGGGFRVEVVSECIGKGRIRRVCFRMASRAEFQAADLAPSGGSRHCGKCMRI
jgi:hypothetical protein